MKILVLNGSPRGEYSVTKQYMLFLTKLFSKDDFKTLNAGQLIPSYKKEDNINILRNDINDSDLIIISYPVYTFLPPSQLYEFLEILNKNNIDFKNKFITQFTTSKHFYDVTAHKVLKECILDLNGKYVEGLSSDMEDLTNNNTDEIIKWFKFVKEQVINEIFETREKINKDINFYNRVINTEKEKTNNKTIALITDYKDNQSLKNMIDDYVSLSPYKVITYNLNDINIKCGCLGCLNCTINGACKIKDDYNSMLDEINKADAFVNAFEIKNHSMSSLFKKYYDRQFVNGHRPINAGKPFAYIISGNISCERTLIEYIEQKSSVGGNYNSGIISDEYNTLKSIESSLYKMQYVLENDVKHQHDFYEIGGMKIFRDMIWTMRGLMKDDYIYYKENDFFDFPQKNRKKMIGIKLVGFLLRNKKISKKMGNVLNDGMISPYKKIIDNTKEIE